MSRLGIGAFRQFFDRLSPHHEKVSALLAHFPLFDSGPSEPEPEERLAEYLRQRARRREMGLPDPEIPDEEKEVRIDEGTVIRGDADNDSGDTGYSGNSGDPADGDREGDEREHREEDSCIG